MKRLLALALSIIMAVSLAGCSLPFGPKAGGTDDTASSAGGETMEYISPDGWSVNYDGKLFEANEIDEHSASFVYQGDSAGSSMVTISYVNGKQPEEAMSEITGNWEGEERNEGFFPGTDDKWGYWRTLKTSDEGSGYEETLIGGEYNGGALLFDIVSHKGNDEEQSMAVSDSLSGIIDSIKYEDFGPQTMYAYYPGTYSNIDSDTGAVYKVILNEGHTGKLSFQDEVDILWGGYEIITADGSARYEYTIEGDILNLNYDGNWLEFSKGDLPAAADASADTAAQDTAASDVTADTAPASEEAAQPADAASSLAATGDEITDTVAYYVNTEIGQYFEASDVEIPYINIIDIDESDPNDVCVYGDFWYFTYKINGDTLETQAGGSFPGCIHLKKMTSGYSVTGMDRVEDGSNFDPSAKKIFGDRYQAFMRMHSDGETREKERADQIAAYVKKNGIMVTKYKDYGWDAVTLQ